MAEIASAAVETGRSIGRYFTVISMVPSLLFVLYIYGLFAANAWPGPFEPAKALHATENLSIAKIVALLVAALLLGLVLHPFQFSMTQLLEGYWGRSCIGLGLARWRIMRYRRAVRVLHVAATEAEKAWIGTIGSDGHAGSARSHGPTGAPKRINALWTLKLATRCSLIICAPRHFAQHSSQYPEAWRRIMPTRLGNVLRRYEDKAGQQYGLDIIRIAPHLNLVALPEHRDYVDDCGKAWI